MGSWDKHHEGVVYQGEAITAHEAHSFLLRRTESLSDRQIECQFGPLDCLSDNFLTSAIARASWAIVMSRFTNLEDVTFGVSEPKGMEAYHDLVPFRIKVTGDQTTSDFLQAVCRQSTEILPFEQTEQHQVAKLNPGSEKGCKFQTALIIRPRHNNRARRLSEKQVEKAALTLDLQFSATQITVTTSFDSRAFESREVHLFMECFELAMKQLDGPHRNNTLRQVELTTAHGIDQIWEWNQQVLEPIERCVHNIISERAHVQPGAPAVCAWDGDLTYRELDEFSTKLAGELMELGIGPDVIVPLCFDKSRWTSVAMLGVLKAGGAFVLLDPLLPEQRLRTIVKQVEASAVICSPSHQIFCSRLVSRVVTVTLEFLTNIDPRTQPPQISTPTPSSPIYVVFTSGSTGEPKGAVLSHGNIASAIHYQYKAFHLTPESRVFDFASYSFDVTISNTLATLATGGCLCVPKEEDRTNKLTESILSLRANFLDLTPSVAQFLVPEAFQGVQTLVLSGEMVSVKDIAPWWGKVGRILNVYGPAECTATSTINGFASSPEDVAGCIGKGAGVVTWVVDPEDHNRLLPPGCVGELLLEGPLLGCGYLKNPAKTSEVFIRDPPWLLRGTPNYPGRHGRLYKTGDLVKYECDGTLRIIGRRDAQVKIHGQRVEMGEVEHHVQQCVPDAKYVVAEVIVPAGKNSSSVLAAFIQATGYTMGAPKPDPEAVRIISVTAEVEEKLATRLPSYMVPTAFFSMQQLPMTPTGKANRKMLKEIGSSFSALQLAEGRLDDRERVTSQPSSQIEQQMQAIWGKVLNLEPAIIGRDHSFFQLGGDSITAMQVSAAARALSINIRTVDVLKKKTISNLTRDLALSSTKGRSSITTNRAFGDDGTELSPIQNLYCELQPDPNKCYDLNFFLKLHKKITSESLIAALATVVGRHRMLRVRFGKHENGIWEQRTTDNVFGSFSLRTKNTRNCTATTAELIAECRESLNIENGPLCAVLLLDDADSQKLFITIHHVVIDLVSWRLVLRELEEILSLGELRTLPAIEFSSWIAMQKDYAAEHLRPDTSITFDIQPPLPGYWEMERSQNLQGDVIMQEFAIDRSMSSKILTDCNGAFGTRPVELLIAGLIRSFNLVFSDRPTPPVFCEGHGREVWDDGIDISTTVGWFTTMYPVQTKTSSKSSLFDTICQTKDCVRGLSQNGWSYFTSRFAEAANAKAFAAEFPAEIVFNYEGFYQQLERDDGLFEGINLPPGCDPKSSGELRRFSLFEVWAKIDRGCIVATISYHKHMLHQYRIQHWIETYRNTLIQMAEQLPQKPLAWTLSDFPLAFGSYDSLREFQSDFIGRIGLQLEDIDDIFPCSPMQEGILLSQTRDTETYRSVIELEVQVNGSESQLDLLKLQQAWWAVVRRHSLLRAVIRDQFPGNNCAMNIILKDSALSMSTVSALVLRGNSENELVCRHGSPAYGKSSVQHHLTIRELGKSRAHLRLEINHAIIDGFSEHILWRDLQTAYHGELGPAGTDYKDFISYLEAQPSSEALEFWASKLDHVEPCLFSAGESSKPDYVATEILDVPRVDAHKIREFCQSWEVTPATVIQTAWALVLRTYGAAKIPCFGTLSSGRDIPVDGMEEVFGPLIGILPCHVDLNQSRSIIDVLRTVQADYLESLPYQHFPLAAIHEALGLGFSPLFNTAISFQKLRHDESRSNGIQFKYLNDCDPTEFDIVLSVFDGSTDIKIELHYRSPFLSLREAERLSWCISTAIFEIIADPSKRLDNVCLVSETDLEMLWECNSPVPVPVERCFHEMVQDKSRSQPNAPAICAWDGDLTYSQLVQLATKLARRLVDLGVRPGIFVPLCFEKSLWTVVAILGVLKAGGAFVLLDPSLPELRLQAITTQVDAKLILSSVSQKKLSHRLTQEVLTIDHTLFKKMKDEPYRPPHAPTPWSVMYAIFTSGSTGAPKGVLISHENSASALRYQQDVMGLTQSSRVYEFSSYSFDACVLNMTMALAAGGCICIPADEDRKSNLAKSIVSLDANTVFLTPSVLQLLSPEDVPCLQTLLVGGEKVSHDQLQPWWGKVRFVQGYGPSECTPFAILHGNAPSLQDALRLGRGKGAVTWVVDQDNHHCLLPPGCIGELLLEGPIVGQGYLNNPEKTTAAFIEDPKWLLRGVPVSGRPGRPGRLYKTGDLVRCDEDGVLLYMGRKDTQVKLRGQRVELGEVEHRVVQCMPNATYVVAEVITPDGQHSNPILAVFVQSDCDMGQIDIESDDGTVASILDIPADIKNHLAKHLPSYMIPAVFFSVQEMPITPSGKINRKLIRELGCSFSVQQLNGMRMTRRSMKLRPTLDLEMQMRDIWALVLNIDAETIGMEDNFFQLGGHSIAAIRVVGEARKVGIKLTVGDIFRHSSLADLTPRVSRGESQSNNFVSIDLIDPMSRKTLNSEIDSLNTGTKSQDVIEILPVTFFQECCLNDDLRHTRQFYNFYYVDVDANLDIAKFRQSCSLVVSRFPILRTCFLRLLGRLWQVVLEQTDDFFQVHDARGTLDQFFNDFCRNDLTRPCLTRPATGFILLKHRTQGIRFVLRLTHAQYDGLSLLTIFRSIFDAYHGREYLQTPSLSTFLRYAHSQQTRSIAYWKKLLHGSSPTKILPKLSPKVIQDSTPKGIHIETTIPLPDLARDITLTSLVNAAWAILLSRLSGDLEDVVYIAVVNGRNSALDGIETMVGPCVNTVPIRVNLPGFETVDDLLRSVQAQVFAMGDADTLNLRDIIKHCTDWPAHIGLDSEFQHLSYGLNLEMQVNGDVAKVGYFDNPHYVESYLCVETRTNGDHLDVGLLANTHLMSKKTAHAVLRDLGEIISGLAECLDQGIPLKEWIAGLQPWRKDTDDDITISDVDEAGVSYRTHEALGEVAC
ncbi:Nonribosomal peptide synthetase dtxS1 [Cladobotryum mycophilum]|uniref:Nonribosomal peptide synthetase dtxS1 n=1 Tax=Cladobotryum mycophilum TaxID=491253 RepID=A0ABR0SQH1_9HYPO